MNGYIGEDFDGLPTFDGPDEDSECIECGATFGLTEHLSFCSQHPDNLYPDEELLDILDDYGSVDCE